MIGTVPMRSLLFAGLWLASSAASAQLAFEGSPWGLQRTKYDWKKVPVLERPALDRQALLAEDEERAAEGDKRSRFGVNHAVDLSTAQHGVWDVLPNGDRVWRMGIELKDAFSVNFEFNEFVVPEGGKVYAYTPDGQVLGAFTAASNPGFQELGVGLLPGDRITIEYNEPASVAGQGRLRIGQVTQAYRDHFAMLKGFNDSGSCNNNVICPVGDDWRDQIRSVAMIVVNGNGGCTGTLLNNCNEDGTPYFLTANHCLGGNVGTWVFAFNWQSPTCTPNTNTAMNQTVSGAQTLFSSANTDVALLRLNTAPPASYQVYHSGWDASGAMPADQTGIHHPSGDLKKISFDNNGATQVTWQGAQCWRVSNWEDGTTEPGSSGSGLWDSNGRLIGQLYGGTASCSSVTHDNYGRFDISYPSLTTWLGSCSNVVDGHDPNGAAFAVDGAVQSIAGIPAVGCNITSVSPQVEIRNAGTQTLTSLSLGWTMTGGGNGTQAWTGSLASGATAMVTMPAVTVGAGAHTYTVTASMPNGVTDMNPVNNSRSFDFSVVSPGTPTTLSITVDDYGSETTWEVRPQGGGAVVASSGGYPDEVAGELFVHQLCLAAGCYTLTVFDEWSDGMCCQYGNGGYTVTTSSGTLVTGNGQFNASASHDFCVDGTVGVEDRAPGILNVWPNPGTGVFQVLLPLSMEGQVHLEVMDLSGRIVLRSRATANGGPAQLDLRDAADGVYVLKAIGDAGTLTQRLVVRR